MVDSARRLRTGPVVVHDNETIVYADRSAVSLLDADSREVVSGTSILEYVATSDQRALADQFDRVEGGDASALGLAITLNRDEGHASEVIAVNSLIQWNGRNLIQTLLIAVHSGLPTGLSADTMDHSPVGISIADARRSDQPLIYVNDQFVELTGYPREEVLGRNCRFLQGEETRAEPVAAMREAIEDEEPVTVEVRNYRKDGSMFWNRVSIQPVTNDDGDVIHFLGFQEDISDRKAYQQEKTLFEMQAESIDKSVFITDAEGTILYVNPQFERTTGYTAAEAVGETPRILKSDAQDESFYERLWETITAGDVWEATITNKRKTGERYTVDQKIVPVLNGDEELTHFVAIEEDVTDAKFTEEVLDVMDRVLRHNVRNSVTAIHGYAEMLEQGDDDPDQQAALRTIQERAGHLNRTSDRAREIRELFRQRDDEHALPIARIVEFVERQRTVYPDARIELSTDIDTEREIRNGSLLQVAIEEAIENAVLHNDCDQPRVHVTITHREDPAELLIEIADDGPGIPESEWNVVFAGEETALVHGTGIGLWLMYWAITALGGTIGHTANEPRGSVIKYRVPLGTGEHVDRWTTT